uniref:Rho related BTB domain containing 3 n=1 Tax=Canis lupus dingo TaxID=286419 RepID=A0A8C0K264_CANLU
MSIHIVALGNEGDAFHQDSRPSGLIRTYLGRSPLVSGDESSLLLSATSTVARPVFTEYQASAFGNVKLVVHDCPVWVSGGSCSVPRRQLSSPSPIFPMYKMKRLPAS